MSSSRKNRTTVRAIQRRVYKKYKDTLMYDSPIAPDLRAEAERQLEDENLTETERRRIQTILDSGVYDELETTVDPEVGAKYEAELDAEIQKAIDAGELDPPDENSRQEFINELKEKQYGKVTKGKKHKRRKSDG